MAGETQDYSVFKDPNIWQRNRVSVLSGSDRKMFDPGVLVFSPHFVRSSNDGEYVGVVCIKTGANYTITTLWTDDDFGSFILSDNIIANVGTDYFDPFLIRIPNGNIICGFHAGGSLYFYRSTDGGRTWAQQSIVAQLAQPTGFTATAVGSGGTFAAGPYFWKIVFTGANGDSIASAEATQTLVLNGSANLAWNATPAGTTNVKVYRGIATGAENTLVTTLGNVTSYTDTGIAGSAGTPNAAQHALSEVCIIRIRQPSTGTPTRLVCSFVDVDPAKARDTTVNTMYSDNEGATWSAWVVATPTSGVNSCAQLSDNLRAWIFEDANGKVQLIYSRKATGSPTEVWATNLNGIGGIDTDSTNPVQIAIASLATSTTGTPQNGVSPSAVRNRDGSYSLFYTAANYGSGGNQGELHQLRGNGSKAGWSGDKIVLTASGAPGGWGRATPHRLGAGERINLFYVFVPSSSTSTLRDITIVG